MNDRKDCEYCALRDDFADVVCKDCEEKDRFPRWLQIVLAILYFFTLLALLTFSIAG
jgi:hypothetical protein